MADKIITNMLIAHATNDEDEDTTPTDGDYGDQNGYELNACKWYSYPWLAVYRSNDKDNKKAEIIAAFMQKAITNGYFGYNQNRNRRKEFFYALQDVEFDPDRVNWNLSTDCSGLAYTAIYAAYRIRGSDSYVSTSGSLDGIAKSGDFDDYLMNIIGDFTKYTSEDYLASADKLLRGDILLADGHVAVWI